MNVTSTKQLEKGTVFELLDSKCFATVLLVTCSWLWMIPLIHSPVDLHLPYRQFPAKRQNIELK